MSASVSRIPMPRYRYQGRHGPGAELPSPGHGDGGFVSRDVLRQGPCEGADVGRPAVAQAKRVANEDAVPVESAGTAMPSPEIPDHSRVMKLSIEMLLRACCCRRESVSYWRMTRRHTIGWI